MKAVVFAACALLLVVTVLAGTPSDETCFVNPELAIDNDYKRACCCAFGSNAKGTKATHPQCGEIGYAGFTMKLCNKVPICDVAAGGNGKKMAFRPTTNEWIFKACEADIEGYKKATAKIVEAETVAAETAKAAAMAIEIGQKQEAEAARLEADNAAGEEESTGTKVTAVGDEVPEAEIVEPNSEPETIDNLDCAGLEGKLVELLGNFATLKTAENENIAKAKANEEADKRIAEINEQIADLNKEIETITAAKNDADALAVSNAALESTKSDAEARWAEIEEPAAKKGCKATADALGYDEDGSPLAAVADAAEPEEESEELQVNPNPQDSDIASMETVSKGDEELTANGEVEPPLETAESNLRGN